MKNYLLICAYNLLARRHAVGLSMSNVDERARHE